MGRWKPEGRLERLTFWVEMVLMPLGVPIFILNKGEVNAGLLFVGTFVQLLFGMFLRQLRSPVNVLSQSPSRAAKLSRHYYNLVCAALVMMAAFEIAFGIGYDLYRQADTVFGLVLATILYAFYALCYWLADRVCREAWNAFARPKLAS